MICRKIRENAKIAQVLTLEKLSLIFQRAKRKKTQLSKTLHSQMLRISPDCTGSPSKRYLAGNGEVVRLQS